MKLFVDSADLAEIAEALDRGIVQGITTNPIWLGEQVRNEPIRHLRKIRDLLIARGLELPLSVQVMTTDPGEISSQALILANELSYDRLAIKIPCDWAALEIIHDLAGRGLQINCTACMTTGQALLAAAAGARYVSLFGGKMSDAGIDPVSVVSDAVPLVGRHRAELIVGSLRSTYDITRYAMAGAHIVTASPRFLRQLSEHFKTGEAVDLFAAAFLPLDKAGD